MVKAAAVDHDHAEFRRIVEDAGRSKPTCRCRPRRSGDYFLYFHHTVRTDSHDLDPPVRQLDRAAHLRSDEPHQHAEPCHGHSRSSSGSISACTPCSANCTRAATIGASHRNDCGRSSTDRRRRNSVSWPRRPGSRRPRDGARPPCIRSAHRTGTTTPRGERDHPRGRFAHRTGEAGTVGGPRQVRVR